MKNLLKTLKDFRTFRITQLPSISSYLVLSLWTYKKLTQKSRQKKKRLATDSNQLTKICSTETIQFPERKVRRFKSLILLKNQLKNSQLSHKSKKRKKFKQREKENGSQIYEWLKSHRSSILKNQLVCKLKKTSILILYTANRWAVYRRFRKERQARLGKKKLKKLLNSEIRLRKKLKLS